VLEGCASKLKKGDARNGAKITAINIAGMIARRVIDVIAIESFNTSSARERGPPMPWDQGNDASSGRII